MSYHITIGTGTIALTTPGSIIGTVFTIATIIATVMLFRKAGREGWEMLIPFYNSYTEYKLFWTTKMFWVSLILKPVTVLCLITIPLISEPVFRITALMGIAGVIAWVVIAIKKTQKTAHAFNRRGMFTVGLFFFNAIFRMIMAFGPDQYAGANL